MLVLGQNKCAPHRAPPRLRSTESECLSWEPGAGLQRFPSDVYHGSTGNSLPLSVSPQKPLIWGHTMQLSHNFSCQVTSFHNFSEIQNNSTRNSQSNWSCFSHIIPYGLRILNSPNAFCCIKSWFHKLFIHPNIWLLIEDRFRQNVGCTI